MHVFLRGNPSSNALVAALLTIALLGTSFALFEPIVSHGQVSSNDFTITQEIQSEISFLTQPGNVTMSPAIQGVTGGTAFGTQYL